MTNTERDNWDVIVIGSGMGGGVDPVSPDSRRLGLGTEADELPRGSELQA